MAEKVKKTIPWFIVVGIVAVLAILVLNAGEGTVPQVVEADTATTAVTVSNAAPAFGVGVQTREYSPISGPGSGVGSTDGNPTNEGDDIKWRATASDSNNDNWYLAICKTNAVSTTSLGAPTCPGGTWTISNATPSGSEITLATSTTGTATSSPWYSFACDHNADSICSNMWNSDVTLESGSPFYTNHRPSFTVVDQDGPINPDGVVTWTTTASDTDLFSVADWVGLYVCKTQSFATGASPGCGGDTWCSTTSASDPSCSYNDADDIQQDKIYDTWVYTVDNHGFDASGGVQDTEKDFTVSNVAPTVGAATISFIDAADGDTDLDLTVPESQTTGFKVNATIVDKNSCLNAAGGSEIATGTAAVTKTWVYRSGVGASCSANANDCYLDLTDCNLGPCGGSSDDTVTSTCTFSMWYVADPTDSTSYYPTENWPASVKAVDDNNASSTTGASSGSEMKSYTAYSLVTNITLDYGTVGAGDTSSEATTTVEATGNTGLDKEVSGQDMESGANVIAIDQQHASTTSGFAWATGITATSTATELEINCKKTTATDTPATSSAYWLIKIPLGKAAGTYDGTNTIVGVINETSTWY